MRSSSFLLAAFFACGVPSGPTGPVTYEADIRPLVETHCQGCHVAGGIAPFALATYDDLMKMQAPALAAIQSRRMPPYLAAKGCTDYQDDISLSDAQIATFQKWLDDGSLRGTEGATTTPPMSAGLTRVDLTLTMPEVYRPTQSPDDYRCFVLDWPQTTDKFVTGFRVVPGNAKVVHHVIAYLIPPAKVANIMQRDAADPLPGYTCFGGPGNGDPSWLGVWAPGGMGSMYPPNTGLQVAAGSKVVLQVHYNLQTQTNDISDQTRIELALEDTVKRRALILPWTDPDWLDGVGMDIPAYQGDVVHSFAYDPTPYTSYLTDGVIPSGVGIRLYSASLHQHLLGKSSRLEIERADGSSECLLDIPRWDFHWQRSYTFARGKILQPGDKMSITCHWDNSAAAQPLINGAQQAPRDVKWGEGTTDEMCLGILYATE
jgi:hypothetical protein